MRLLIAAIGAAFLAACGAQTSADTTPYASPAGAQSSAGIDAITPQAIEAHIRFLADDLMEGREAGTRGYDLAARYVATQFELMGLEPAGDDGGFYAQAQLQTMRSVPADTGFSITSNGETVTLTARDDYVTSSHPVEDRSTASGRLVFAGHGVSAANHGHDDYAGLDVAGAIVVIMRGTPSGLPSEENAHHSSGSTKLATAAERGAVGVVTIHVEGMARGASLAMLSRLWGERDAMNLAPGAAAPAYSTVLAEATISQGAAETLFEAAGQDFAAIIAAAQAGEALPGFEMGAEARITQATTRTVLESPNIVARLRGSDPALAGEYVVLTAHVDHTGICRPETEPDGAPIEDRICNGAMDNASGVATLLETARAFIAEGAPRRSVLFIGLTAEEKGLLGSQYYARNPTVPQDAMVANVNLDMPVMLYEFNDVIAFGAEHSELGPIAERAASLLDVSLTPDPLPQQNLFVRSDHYNFVRAGVPAIFLMTGFSSPDEAHDEGRGFLGFLSTHYHRPSDDLSLPIRFDQGAKFARINFMIAREIANSDERPRWNEGNFFGNTFAGTQ